MEIYDGDGDIINEVDQLTRGADLVIVHEFNEPLLAGAVGDVRKRRDDFVLLFHNTHHRQGQRFKVDWYFFDESALRDLILSAPGFEVEGELDLTVNWNKVSPQMLEFHGYPYTSVGVALVKK